MIEPDQADHLLRCEVLDTYGETVGPVAQVWLAEDTGQPVWASVRTGALGLGEATLPLHTAELHDEQIHVPFSKEHITRAPAVDLAEEAMTGAEHTALTRHYDLPDDGSLDQRDGLVEESDSAWPPTRGQLPYRQPRRDSGTAAAPALPDDPRPGDRTLAETADAVEARTGQAPGGRFRLVKYVVTELKQVTVEVAHEEVRLEREPVTGGEPLSSSDDIALEAEPEVTLYAEKPVVHTEIVPVERVRLVKTAARDDDTATGVVRSEPFDIGDDAGRSPS